MITEPINPNAISQADYLKLFMQELTYQDPLKPLDNREFMTQMAQFSSLQEARTTNESLMKLLGMTSGNQSLSLLGKKVKIKDTTEEAIVTKVVFYEQEPPKIHVFLKNGKSFKVELGQIMEVLN